MRAATANPAAMRRRTALLAVLAAAAVGLPSAGAALPEVCTRTPDPARWLDAGAPDEGAEHAVVAVHRGAANLAPENTIAAYEYAIAYDMDMIEVDVQQTADHRYVAFHDLDVEPKTDGTGTFPVLTQEQALSFNVAANSKWAGSAYDPSRMPTLEEVLALAAKHEVGIMFDLKESVTDAASVALMARDAGVVPRSVFIPYVPARAEAIKAAVPEALLNFSTQGFSEAPGGVTPGVLYAASKEYGQFGSSLPDYTAERIAEVHDGCGIVVPNVYQGDVTGSEAGDLAHARALGADGAQVNNPDVAADVLDRPVPTALTSAPGQVCLVDGLRGLGLPGKTLSLGDGSTVVTGPGGCVTTTGPAGRVQFAGDGSALPSTTVDPRDR